MRYVSELDHLAQAALAAAASDEIKNPVMTKGIMVVEFLNDDIEGRSVVALQIGPQAPMQPWEILGLVAVVQARAQRRMLEQME